jgi:hypothetical protein
MNLVSQIIYSSREERRESKVPSRLEPKTRMYGQID